MEDTLRNELIGGSEIMESKEVDEKMNYDKMRK